MPELFQVATIDALVDQKISTTAATVAATRATARRGAPTAPDFAALVEDMFYGVASSAGIPDLPGKSILLAASARNSTLPSCVCPFCNRALA